MFDFIKEIFASFRQASLERIKSPVLGAFVFSWLGFNWQMVAIVMFSDKAMESRIEYINQRFDIGDYLFGPIYVTVLICIILPQVNKWVTKIQGKPNSETVMLSLAAKISIAQQQQQIAEIEAKKKLAEKREEKNIEDEITLILKRNNDLVKHNVSLTNKITDNEILLSDNAEKINKNNELINRLTLERDQVNVAIREHVKTKESYEKDIVNLQKEISDYEMKSIRDSDKILQQKNSMETLKKDFNGERTKLKMTLKYNKEMALLFPKYLMIEKDEIDKLETLKWKKALFDDYQKSYPIKSTDRNP